MIRRATAIFVLLPALALAIATWPAMGEQQIASVEQPGKIVALQRADQLRGQKIVHARVMSGTGKDAQIVGEIEDMLIDADGHVAAALIGVGGFLGIGNKTVAVAWDALTRIETDSMTVTYAIDLSRDALERAPAFMSSEAQKAAAQKREVIEKAREQSPAADVLKPGGATGKN